MDYDLDRLGNKQFEHLSQSLTAAEVGARVSTFGAGADGGREATWTGGDIALSTHGDWRGYSVLQAKHREFPEAPASNLTWLKRQLREEIARWSAHRASKSRKLPEFYLVSTNVRLSAADGGGKDEIAKWLGAEFSRQGLRLTGWRIWDYDDLRLLLDKHGEVRRAYRALVTPGDVLFNLLEPSRFSERFDLALQLHAANQMRREHRLKLGQAGEAKDTPLPISAVYMDLPYIGIDTLQREPRVTAHLFDTFDSHSNQRPTGSNFHVLIGGPGQGKSTVSQFIALSYRAAFLGGSTVINDAETSKIAADIERRQEHNSLHIASRRWPARIVLSEFADSLAAGETKTVLDFLAAEISQAGQPVTSGDLSKWMEDHPWLVILDGFDEVPATSDRQAVLQSVADLVSHANTVGADVHFVATTRPQGYSNEFSRSRNIHLAPLSPSEALGYAEEFLTARNGANTAANDRTNRELRKAVRVDATRRLFESPLQVTILAILLERLGHTPGDRWQLFWNYYQVIMQREQEKPGELAQLLRQYTSDINYLHRKVGILLQESSAQSGRASASLTTRDFASIVEERLLEMEHSPGEAKHLTDRILSLATERLVFLARLSAESIGFEIRSIQEFMAAEHVVLDCPESSVLDHLRLRSLVPHWRNVILFAVGRIFFEKELLKPGVDHLCADLDSASPAHSVNRSGGRLALDILLDGSCANQPKYARTLAARAGSLLSAVDLRLLAGLERLPEGHARKVVRAEASRLMRLGEPASFGALSYFAREAAAGDEESAAAVNSHFENAMPSAQAHLVKFAWGQHSLTMDEAASSLLEDLQPSNFLGEQNSIVGYADPENLPSNLLSRLKISCSPAVDSDRIEVLHGEHSLQLSIVLRRVLDCARPLKHPALENLPGSEWSYVRAAARADTADGVAVVLASLAKNPSLASLQIRHSWLVEGLLKWCVGDDGANMDYLDGITSAVRNGVLGSIEEWTAAEDRAVANGVQLEHSGTHPLDDKYSLEDRLDAILLHGGSFEASSPYDAESLAAAIRDCEILSEVSASTSHISLRATYLDLLHFMASLSSRAIIDNADGDLDAVVLHESQRALDRFTMNLLASPIPLATPLSGALWIDWLGSIASPELIESDYLAKLAASRISRPEPNESLALALYGAALENSTAGILRLCVLFDPRLIFSPAMEDWTGTEGLPATLSAAMDAARLIQASPGSGELEALLGRLVADGPHASVFEPSVLRLWLEGLRRSEFTTQEEAMANAAMITFGLDENVAAIAAAASLEIARGEAGSFEAI
ncbi:MULTISPECIES: NACHT domain-containing NTPase [unclassified Curtobacterium]|uniref:NACHT domain-containing protein n=1 Tax=unclassified Curtobacterium TaxID=257496 RepID=UPI0011B802DE|nr:MULTISPECIES: hypothetical protein [unclassified Curtobacterium]